jgi:predicted Ser/Thr protein kinase
MIGERIGRYRIDSEIGRGGMGVVFKATQLTLNRTVAVKMLSHDLARSGEYLARFGREAETLARLAHEDIVHIYDIEEIDSAHFIIMEYVDGPSLTTLLSREFRLKPARARDITVVLANALAVAHDRGIIHRDIKPDNIIFTSAGRPKLTDFGIAHMRDDSTFKTRTGIMLGTPYYIAPEQALGQPVSPASDIYSLGVVLFEMLSGRVPFTGGDALSVAIKHIRDAAPPLKEVAPELPTELCRVVHRTLEKNPFDRYGSAEEFQETLVDLDLGITAGRALRVPVQSGEGAHAFTCPDCGTALRAEFLTCPKCGLAIRHKCTRCGTLFNPISPACPFCRTPAPSPQAVPVAVAEVTRPAAEAPVAVEEAPPESKKALPAVEEAPAAAVEAPATVKEAPAAMVEAPAEVKETPVPVEEIPTAVQELPARARKTAAVRPRAKRKAAEGATRSADPGVVPADALTPTPQAPGIAAVSPAAPAETLRPAASAPTLPTESPSLAPEASSTAAEPSARVSPFKHEAPADVETVLAPLPGTDVGAMLQTPPPTEALSEAAFIGADDPLSWEGEDDRVSTLEPEAPEPEIAEVKEPEAKAVTEPEIPEVVEPEITEVAEPEVAGVMEPEIPEVVEPEITEVTEPEVAGVMEPKIPEVVEPEITEESRLDATAIAEPRIVEAREPESAEPTAHEVIEQEIADLEVAKRKFSGGEAAEAGSTPATPGVAADEDRESITTGSRSIGRTGPYASSTDVLEPVAPDAAETVSEPRERARPERRPGPPVIGRMAGSARERRRTPSLQPVLWVGGGLLALVLVFAIVRTDLVGGRSGEEAAPASAESTPPEATPESPPTAPALIESPASIPPAERELEETPVDRPAAPVPASEAGGIETPGRPLLQLSTATLSFQTAAKGPAPPAQEIRVTNGGDGTMPWSANDDAQWLEASPMRGTGTETLRLNVEPGSLPSGTHRAALTIDAGEAGRQTVAVTFTIDPLPPAAGPTEPGGETPTAPIIGLSATQLSFLGRVGGAAPSAQKLGVTNTGGTPPAKPFSWKVTENAPWLAVSPASGTGRGSVTVRANTTNLAPGVYRSRLEVSAEGGTPKAIPVVLKVDPPPTVAEPQPAPAPPPAPAAPAEAPAPPPAPSPKEVEAAARSEIQAIVERQRRATETGDRVLAVQDLAPALQKRMADELSKLHEGAMDISSRITDLKIEFLDPNRANVTMVASISFIRRKGGERESHSNKVRWELKRVENRWLITKSS